MRRADQLLACFIGLALLLLCESAAAEPSWRSGSAHSWQLTVLGDRMSANIHGVRLSEILQALAQELSVSVTVRGSVANEPVAVSFHDLSIEEGIEKILLGKDYAMLGDRSAWAQSPYAVHQIRRIIVLSRSGGGGGQWTELSGNSEAPRAELLKRAFGANDGGDRLEALVQWVQQAGQEEIVPVLVRALTDRDSGVRGVALEFLEREDATEALDTIAKIARDDSDTALRLQALALLADQDADMVIEPLKHALRDSDQEVRTGAAQILERLADDVLGHDEQPGP